MTDPRVANLSMVTDIRSKSNNDEKATLFLESISGDPYLLAELKHIKRGGKIK